MNHNQAGQDQECRQYAHAVARWIDPLWSYPEKAVVGP